MPDLPATAADLDLRLVRYFIAVAEHGNFHRAADALHVAQPSLSRQIQRLEDEVGARLLERTNQGSRLTAAGEIFLPQARELVGSALRAVVTTRAEAQPDDLTLGYTGNLHVTAVVRALRERFPGADVRTLHLEPDEVRNALREHRVDAVLAREPVAGEGLARTPLYEEPRALMVPTTHRLAGRTAVTLDDFGAEPLVRYPDPAYDAFWRIDPRPDGSRAPEGPLVTTVPDKLELIAGGQALALVPDCGDNRVLRRDVTTVPVTGIPPTEVVLAVRADDHRPVLTEIAALAAEQPRA